MRVAVARGRVHSGVDPDDSQESRRGLSIVGALCADRPSVDRIGGRGKGEVALRNNDPALGPCASIWLPGERLF